MTPVSVSSSAPIAPVEIVNTPEAKLNCEGSALTAMASAETVIPCQCPMFSVTSPSVPPPLSPDPANTEEISPPNEVHTGPVVFVQTYIVLSTVS